MNNNTLSNAEIALDCSAGAGPCAPGALPPTDTLPPGAIATGPGGNVPESALFPGGAPPPLIPQVAPPVIPPGIPGDSPPPLPPLIGSPPSPAPMSPGPVASWPEGNAADCANDVYAAHFNLFCATQPGNVVATTPYANGTPLDNPQLKPGGPGS